jgi:large subunit ribosomal protein L17
MICSLLEHEHITTTLPKAKELRPLTEKVITLGKRYQAAASDAERLALRRRAITRIGDESVASKLLTTIAERFQARPGGYCRIVKAGRRYGDNAPMAVISLV